MEFYKMNDVVVGICCLTDEEYKNMTIEKLNGYIDGLNFFNGELLELTKKYSSKDSSFFVKEGNEPAEYEIEFELVYTLLNLVGILLSGMHVYNPELLKNDYIKQKYINLKEQIIYQITENYYQISLNPLFYGFERFKDKTREQIQKIVKKELYEALSTFSELDKFYSIAE